MFSMWTVICGLLKIWFCKRLMHIGTTRKRTSTVDKEVLQQTFGKRMYSMVLPRRWGWAVTL
jgi:hypothetical protein